ncbi:acylneuraminate cytidylyltransferase family protein [Algiphilus sp. NNCM1]|uniref:acylneuraminate cytidylyltransferase family protein n=1 Tax=Algiphilus sp. TaxID=1872431 RepID=UPI001CA6E1DF|nr:acylneuraminate cytidylyltransferase family protein [Algiphilus sp.]MBY8965041.1 acylneuraminate cytidylyltransferase family protein [Algiphilus acroporae]MCI5104197.1 acylneuraminate cytidylyltransferase family protein [Algiphilus sp.]
MTEKVTCFLPCRAGSERVRRKNVRPFAGYEYGLIQVKLRQLLASESIDEVVLTTDDPEILDYASSIKALRLRTHRRSEELSSSTTSTDQLVAHALDLVPDGHILWTHVTSPFITEKLYDQLVDTYFAQLQYGYDSLMTVTSIHGFLWQNGEPVNYDRNVEKWPRTQTLEPVHEINSGAFLSSTIQYHLMSDRIGRQPYMYSMNKITGFDIDSPEDFALAECLVEKRLVAL